MTINSEIRRAGPFVGTGVTTQFPFVFKVFRAEDLYVVRADADGVETPLELGTDYTVALNPDQNANPGGEIITPVALPVGFTLTATSALDYLQPIDLTNQGGFYPRVINDGLDRLTIFAQQLEEGLGRSLKVPLSDGRTPQEYWGSRFDRAEENATAAAQSADEAKDYRDSTQIIADKFGDVDSAVSQTEALHDATVLERQTAQAARVGAEVAADRAETASDAAFVNADVYPDVLSGRDAVAVGEQFQVVEGDELVRYRKDGSTSAIAVARVLNAAGTRRIGFDNNRIRQVDEEQPNLLPRGQVMSESLPTATVTGTAELTALQGEPAVRITGTSTARCYWSVPASQITSGVISAYLLIRQADAGSGGSVRLIQRDASGAQVDATDISGGPVGNAFTDREFSGSGIPLHPDAVTLHLDANIVGEGRVFVAQYPMIAEGAAAGFRRPPDPVLLPGVDDALVQATNVLRYEYALPLDITVLPPTAGSISVTPVIPTGSAAVSLDIVGSSNFGSSYIAAAELGPGLRGGEVLRLVFTLGDSNNAALGLLFGDSASARGFALRENGQALILNAPSGTTGSIPVMAGAFSQGDRMVVDARVHAGSEGDYTVRYFVEYPDGTRSGPYDVSGIESLERAWYGVRARATANNVELFRFKAPRYSGEWGGSGSVSGSKTVYVDQSGSDDGTGAPSSPFKTINRALSEIQAGGGIVELGGGDYREAVVASSPEHVWIRSKQGERANIFGSEQLVVTKTAGYTQVYQAPLAAKPVGMGAPRGLPVIFEWGTPSKPIPADERHPAQRGRSHRLPYTEMFEAESLAALDTVDGLGKWWWDAGVIYFAATDGGDAREGRYEARARRAFAQGAGGLRLSRVDVYFSSSYGASFGGDLAVTEDVRVLGSFHNGFYHSSGVWHSFRDEAGGNGNDGFNGTVTNRVGEYDDSGDRITAFLYDPYGHDNGDDGTSYHYRSDQTLYGGLFEHNTKADVVHVTGASVTCFDTVVRGGIHGFYTSSAPDNDLSRVVTSLRCVGTVAINNQYSYRAGSGCYMECSNAVAVNPSVRGYAQSGDGVLVARNSKYTGDPAKMKDGNVEVINDGALT